MAKLQTETRNFKFQTEDEKPKEFIITFNGQDWAVNTRGVFVSTDDVAKALNEAKKAIKAK